MNQDQRGCPVGTTDCLSHLQQTRRRYGHAVRRGHHLLAQLPRHVLHHRPLVKNARLEVKIPEMSLDPRADAIRQSAIQRILRNFLRVSIDIGKVNAHHARAHVCVIYRQYLYLQRTHYIAQPGHVYGLDLYFSTCPLEVVSNASI